MSDKTVIGEEEVLTPFMRSQMDAFYAQVDEDLFADEQRLVRREVRRG